ncbi:MAG TPA: trypsin-like peptidase domain-containing protein [Candidatus Saccharimonadales bacterium]|jgi:serine protease Do
MEESDEPRKTNNDVGQKKLTVTMRMISPSRLKLDRHKIKFLAVALLLIVSIAAGFLGGWLGAASKDNSDSNSVAAQKEVVLSQSQLISQIAKTVGPSVVSVNVTSQQATTPDDFFGFAQPQQDQSQQSAGTGIIISSDGLIITNRHVVPAGTTSVSVTLSDGTQLDNVQVVGRTSTSDSLDIAFLKITNAKGHKLVPARLGDSSKMKVGDNVVAIGNALGQFQNTVTSGIISGYGRTVQASEQGSSTSMAENLEDLFQTDAAINEGNSGGPLVNVDGQVIGINTAVASDAQGIGFAIPINDVSGLIKSVLSTGKFLQPYLGVRYLSLTNDYASQLKLKATRGAYVIPANQDNGQAGVVSGSPADKAGLKEGDVIQAVDGTNIDDSHSLTALLDQHSVGDSVNLKVLRSGKQLNIRATLGSAPSGNS